MHNRYQKLNNRYLHTWRKESLGPVHPGDLHCTKCLWAREPLQKMGVDSGIFQGLELDENRKKWDRIERA